MQFKNRYGYARTLFAAFQCSSQSWGRLRGGVAAGVTALMVVSFFSCNFAFASFATVPNGERSWTVEVANISRCSGALIDDDVVITAAHCIGDAFGDVVVTLMNNGSEKQIISAREVIIHPNYPSSDGNRRRFDIALVVLEEPADPRFERIALATRAVSELATNEGAAALTTRNYIHLPASSPPVHIVEGALALKDCNELPPGINRYDVDQEHICAESGWVRRGDSGSAVVYDVNGKYYHIALISNMIMTRTDFHKDWIEEQIKRIEEEKKLAFPRKFSNVQGFPSINPSTSEITLTPDKTYFSASAIFLDKTLSDNFLLSFEYQTCDDNGGGLLNPGYGIGVLLGKESLPYYSQNMGWLAGQQLGVKNYIDNGISVQFKTFRFFPGTSVVNGHGYTMIRRPTWANYTRCNWRPVTVELENSLLSIKNGADNLSTRLSNPQVAAIDGSKLGFSASTGIADSAHRIRNISLANRFPLQVVTSGFSAPKQAGLLYNDSPALRWENYLYVPYKYNDNRFQTRVIAYDHEMQQVGSWELYGVRYISNITIDHNSRNIVFHGDGNQSRSLTFDQLGVN